MGLVSLQLMAAGWMRGMGAVLVLDRKRLVLGPAWRGARQLTAAGVGAAGALLLARAPVVPVPVAGPRAEAEALGLQLVAAPARSAKGERGGSGVGTGIATSRCWRSALGMSAGIF